MPAEVVGVKDVQAGLSFIDEDMRERIRAAIDPLMRQVAENSKKEVPSNNDVLSGWSKPYLHQILNISHFLNMMLK
jgi:hypothetical protein